MTIACPFDRRRFVAGAALLAGGSLVGGCAGGLAAIAPAAATDERRRMPVLTTRAPVVDGRRKPWFGAARAGRPTAAYATVETPSAFLGGRIADVDPLVGEPYSVFAGAAGNGPAMLYTHGYNETFESAVLSYASLADGIAFRGTPALFTWPSKAGLLDYGFDRESALWSRDALEEGILALARRDEGKVHLVAHSLGSHLMLESLRQMKTRHGDAFDARIGAIVLASPDIDVDLFGRLVARTGDLLPRITVIVATNDRALAVSAKLSGSHRVGAADRAAIEGFGVRVVDATEHAGGLMRHDAFLSNPEVRAVVQRAIERVG